MERCSPAVGGGGVEISIQARTRSRRAQHGDERRACDVDRNDRTAGSGDFTPFIAAPCFPSYPSAHASASYAGRSVLQRVWGGRGHSIVLSHPAVPGVTVDYETLEQITDDIDDARVFGGIHFRFDQEAGAKQGRNVGRYIYEHVLERNEDQERDDD